MNLSETKRPLILMVEYVAVWYFNAVDQGRSSEGEVYSSVRRFSEKSKILKRNLNHFNELFQQIKEKNCDF